MWTHARIRLGTLSIAAFAAMMPAAASGQTVVDPTLEISVYISPEFLTSPTFFVFLPKNSPNDPDDVLVTGGTGFIKHYRNGAYQGVAIDLPIAYQNEHGIFGIAAHPDFPESSYVYVQYTSSTTGMDSSNLSHVQDNRLVRMEWDPNTGTLAPPQLILLLPAFPGPNHNGGVVLVGPDRKLYGSIGDLNNNGQLQNIPTGPAPDDKGMLYRVDLDGTPPSDNPFFGVGGPIQKVYAYGTRNCFGMDFDPLTNILWMTDNGPASYDEINLVMPGTNLGWKEIGGPASRSTGSVDSLWMAPGAIYSDPEFSWLQSFGVTSIHFIRGTTLGPDYQYDCLVAAHNPLDVYHFEVNPDRMSLVMPDVSLADLVSDNLAERDRSLWAVDVGVITDIETGPDGAVYLCSSSNALIYRIAALTQPRWVNATSGPLGNGSPGSGVAWLDFDGDGDDDLYVTNDGANKLFRNEGANVFADATVAPLADAGNGRGVAAADYDNDGDLDLYLANHGGANKLFRNDGGGAFSDVTAGPLGNTGDGRGVAWADYDLDGDVDLYVVNAAQPNVLLRNDGGTFTDVTSGALVGTNNGRSAAWGDADNDGDPDLYLANDGANALLRNDGGTFVDATSGPLGNAGATHGVAWGDCDNDGDLDLYMTNTGPNVLLRNNGDLSFTDVTVGVLADAGAGRGVAWFDADLDGDLDLYVVNDGQANKLLRNDGGGTFADATVTPLGDTGAGRGVGAADSEGDGDIDLYVVNNAGTSKLFRYDHPGQRHWLQVRLQGTISNESAIGARVRVVTGGTSQIREIVSGSGYLSQNTLSAHFGIGLATSIDTMEVRWPSGLVERIIRRPPVLGGSGVPVDTILSLIEGETTSDVDPVPGSQRVRLHPAVPNPFNPSTTLTYEVVRPARTHLAVYDSAGRLVRVLQSGGVQNPGTYHASWDGRDNDGRSVASGTYVVRLDAGTARESRKVVLVR